jgi:hypothetical protein
VQSGLPAAGSEDAMNEFRRLKMKIGDAEFEADVPEDKVQPMYDQFLFMVEQRGSTSLYPLGQGRIRAKAPDIGTSFFAGALDDDEAGFDRASLRRIFDLRQDGAVVLKVLPKGPDKAANALLLLLYGYHQLKNEEYVLATQLFRAAEQSGISIRRPALEHARDGRFVTRGGHRKGSNYALNSLGLEKAKEITARIIG